MKPKVWIINVYWQNMKSHDARDNIEGVFHNKEGVEHWLLHRRQEWAKDEGLTLHSQKEIGPGDWESVYVEKGVSLVVQKDETIYWGEGYLNIHGTVYTAHEMEVQ